MEMYSWEVLPPVTLTRPGAVSAAFLKTGARNFREAGQFISALPYGRNAAPDHPLAVLLEGRGTCSTKHALLRRLAIEQEIDIKLVLGIYEMSEQNTPGVGEVLGRYGLTSLPEAHCYLRAGALRIDLTRACPRIAAKAIENFLHEQDIEPEQAGEFKVALHRRFLNSWILEGRMAGFSLPRLWQIREECIAALASQRGRFDFFSFVLQ